MSMPLPGDIRYPSTAANREMRWEREHRAIHVSEVTHRTYRDFRRTLGNRCSPCGAAPIRPGLDLRDDSCRRVPGSPRPMPTS
jgi:hypothetical protein